MKTFDIEKTTSSDGVLIDLKDGNTYDLHRTYIERTLQQYSKEYTVNAVEDKETYDVYYGDDYISVISIHSYNDEQLPYYEFSTLLVDGKFSDRFIENRLTRYIDNKEDLEDSLLISAVAVASTLHTAHSLS